MVMHNFTLVTIRIDDVIFHFIKLFKSSEEFESLLRSVVVTNKLLYLGLIKILSETINIFENLSELLILAVPGTQVFIF